MNMDMSDDRECTDAEGFRHDARDVRDCAAVEVSWVARDWQGRDMFDSDMTITGYQAAAMFEGIAAACEPPTPLEQIAEEAAVGVFAELGIDAKGEELAGRALGEFCWQIGDSISYEEGLLAFARNVIAVVKREGVES